jgi:hypothetical protein
MPLPPRSTKRSATLNRPINFADEAAKESATYNASEDAYNHAYDDCIGYYGSENLAYIGFAAAFMFFIGALIRSRFKNPPPGTTTV